MKASELRPGQFFEFVGDHMHTRWRSLASRIEGRAWYMNSHFVMYWCGLDCDVTPLAVAGWDDEPKKDIESMEVQEQAFAWRTIFDWCEAHGCDYLHDGTSLENTIAFLNGLVETAPSTPEPLHPLEAERNAFRKHYEATADASEPEPEPEPEPQPFKAGDLVVCVDDTNSDLVGGKLYRVENVSVTVRDLKLVDTHCWWMHSRFRHATAAEIEQYMQSHPEARSKSMQKRIEAMTEPKPLQLAEGKYYELENHEVVGPSEPFQHPNYPVFCWNVGGRIYTMQGECNSPGPFQVLREVPPPVSEPAKVDAWRVSPSRSTGDYEEHLTVDGARQHIQELLDEWEWSDDLTIAIENVEVVEPAKLEQKRQDDEGWIAWHSNRCPTELSQLVRVVWREDGSESKCYLAREVDWGAVTHYRVVEQPPAKSFDEQRQKIRDAGGSAWDGLNVDQEIAAMRGEAQGTEARVCQDIAERQALGIAKYGTTVEKNPLCLLEWLRHAYHESLDQSVYLKRAIEELEANEPCGVRE